MGFVKLNRYGDPGTAVFDPQLVVEKARAAFSDVSVLPADQLELSTERAAAAGAPDHIVRTLRRNQQDYGPAFAFEIEIGNGKTIQGRARRYDVTFLFATPLAQAWQDRLRIFLQSLGSGRLERGEADVVKPSPSISP